jgi:hypothetical protein
MNTFRIVSSFVVAAAIVLTAVPASAGRKVPWPVTVDLPNRTAHGSIGSTRNSPDSVAQLGCSVSYDSVNKKNHVNCVAVDAKGVGVQCVSEQPELVQIGLGINGDSFRQIWWKDGICTNILVDNHSIYEPKAP